MPAVHPSSARNVDAGGERATSTTKSEAAAVDVAVGGGMEGSQGSVGERGDPKKKAKAGTETDAREVLKAARAAIDDDDFQDF